MTFAPDVVSLSPNHSPGQPSGKKVIVHATRSGVSHNPSEFEGTLNHFANPASQVSAHGLIGRDGRIARIVPDSQTAWHAAVRYPDGRVIEHNTTCWGWELEQGVESDGFTIKQMESLARVGRYYVDVFGVAPQHITDISKSGFIGHQETPQGLAVGKSDPGSQFMWQAFISSLEDDMDKAEVEAIVMAMQFRARPPGEAATGEHTLEFWLGDLHKHKQDAAKHSAGEAHTHPVPASETGEA